MKKPFPTLFLLSLSSLAFSNTTITSTLKNTTPQGGIYVGYYQEDPRTNPEDPTTGSVYLNLPEGNAPFSGSMNFTYVGCQTSNIGTVSGNKTGNNLIGKWTGTLDGLAQSGLYQGHFNQASQSYQGTYTNDKGKQFRDLRPCITYYIAPNGTWELFPLNTTQSKDKTTTPVAITKNTISWNAPRHARYFFLSLLDAEKIESSKRSDHAHGMVWQTILMRHTSRFRIPAKMLPNHRYIILVVGSADGKKHNYVSNAVFTYTP
jgi:hypothetical protein